MNHSTIARACLAITAALFVSCSTIDSSGDDPVLVYFTGDDEAVTLIDRDFETTWSAAVMMARARTGEMKEYRPGNQIIVEGPTRIVIYIESVTKTDTKVRVSAREFSGLSPDRKTARWVAESIYNQARQS